MRKPASVVILAVFIVLLPSLVVGDLSSKGRKLLQEGQEGDSESAVIEDNIVEEEDDFFDVGDDFFGDEDEDEEEEALEQDPFSTTSNETLVTCDNSTVLPSNATCVNGTVLYQVEEPEVRYRDLLLERLITQIWSDLQTKVNEEAQIEVRGENKTKRVVVIDPLDIDALLPKPIDIQQTSSLYQVDVKMKNMRIFGLSQVRLDSAQVTRSENLTDLAVDFRVAFDFILINGTYDMKGSFGWWTVDSKGEQSFSISMENATFSYRMTLDLLRETWENQFECFDDAFPTGDFDEPQVGNVYVTKIGMPLDYDDVDFNFENLGGFANTVANGVGIYFLQSQEDMLIGKVKKAIKDNISSLIC